MLSPCPRTWPKYFSPEAGRIGARLRKYPDWVSGKAHMVVSGAASLLPVAPRVERRHCNQTQELGQESSAAPLWFPCW